MRRFLAISGAAGVALIVGVGVAFAMGILNLPTVPVIAHHTDFGGGLGGTAFDITLSEVPPGFDVTNGVYTGWCLEQNRRRAIEPDDPVTPVILVDSTDDPDDFPEICVGYEDVEWDKINYLLNNLPDGYYPGVVQEAIWLLAGTRWGEGNPPGAAVALADDADQNGDGFIPQPGQITAVGICSNGLQDMVWPQDSILELLIPPPGGEGCTPGYWKKEHHFCEWPEGVIPAPPGDATTFFDVFGVGPDVPLAQALRTGGGGRRALGRHASAAFLNAMSSGVAYRYSVTEVILFVQGAYASGNYEDAKDILEAANENGCPLGNCK